MSRQPTELERTRALFEFLQGSAPRGYSVPVGEMPRLTSDQAWTVVWYLGNQYWRVPDFIQRCDRCGDLYNSECDGGFREPGDVGEGVPSGFRCDSCIHEFEEARRS